MNTTAKGNILEDFVYDYLQKTVKSQGNDGLVSIVQKHKSYKMDGDDSYVADVSIDKYLRKEDIEIDKPTFSIIYECKNYKRDNTVDKSDFQEFLNKIEHTRYTRVKGYMVTTSSFSAPIISSANYQGIGLIKVNLDDESHEIIVSRRLNCIEDNDEMYQCLVSEKQPKGILVFDNYKFTDLRTILANNKITLTDEFSAVKYFRNVEIEQKALDLLNLAKAKELNVNLVLDKLISFLGLQKEQMRMDNGQLGMLNIKEKKIVLSVTLTGHRRNFTIAHEFGHYILHSTMLENLISEYGETLVSIRLDSYSDNYLERQANYFASSLLLPQSKIIYGFNLFRQKEDIRQNYIYVDSQPDNIHRYMRMQDYLRDLFNVSWQAIEIRLKQLNLLQFGETYQPKHISDYLNNYN